MRSTCGDVRRLTRSCSLMIVSVSSNISPYKPWRIQKKEIQTTNHRQDAGGSLHSSSVFISNKATLVHTSHHNIVPPTKTRKIKATINRSYAEVMPVYTNDANGMSNCHSILAVDARLPVLPSYALPTVIYRGKT
jgi:hypothetical protein